MRAGAWILVICAVSLSLVSISAAQEQVTVKGEIVDLACYLSLGKKGPSHRSCAQLCAKKGVPIGVLTEEGQLYLLIDDHANEAPYEAAKKLAGSNAEVSGKKYVKDGMSSILVGSAQGL